MSSFHSMVDYAAVVDHRRRLKSLANEVTFFHEQAADEMKARLSEINRQFADIGIVTGRPDFWASKFPNASLLPDFDVLDFETESRDLVVHAMAMHWAGDPVGQLIQCRRALRQDGLLFVVMFGGNTLAELRIAIAEAEIQVKGGISPRIAPMGDLRDLGDLLYRAGLALPVADRLEFVRYYASCTELMLDLRSMGETNALAERLTSFSPRKLFQETEQIYRDRFSDTDGRLRATFELVFLTGWAPGPNQQQPLKPGTANVRLAEALSQKFEP